MKTARTLSVLSLMILGTSPAFAGAQDLHTFRTLLKAGAQMEQFMSQIHLGLDDVECAYSASYHSYDCHMTDIAANEGQGGPLELRGRKARAVYDLLEQAGAPRDNGMGKTYLAAKSIRCTQALPGVAEGSAAERTSCTLNFDSSDTE